MLAREQKPRRALKNYLKKDIELERIDGFSPSSDFKAVNNKNLTLLIDPYDLLS